MHIFGVQAQRVACLAQQSSRGLAPIVQSTPPPRKSRQRSRLNDTQAIQTVTTLLNQHHNITNLNPTKSYCTHTR